MDVLGMKLFPPSDNLTRRTLVEVVICIAIVVAIATAISYFHVSMSLQTQTLEQLEDYIVQRGLRESTLFQLAEANLRTFTRGYAQRLTAMQEVDPQPRFSKLFIRRADGSLRLREDLFENYGITGVIGKQTVLTPDLRRRLVLGFDMLIQYGPAWRNRFVNLYLTTPEKATLMFWPGKPWGLKTQSWKVIAKLPAYGSVDEAFVIDEASQDKLRASTWSNPYYDDAVNDWVSSTSRPLELNRSSVRMGASSIATPHRCNQAPVSTTAGCGPIGISPKSNVRSKSCAKPKRRLRPPIMPRVNFWLI
jgi:hypothetical protein